MKKNEEVQKIREDISDAWCSYWGMCDVAGNAGNYTDALDWIASKLEEREKDILEELLNATAHLVAAISAYETYAGNVGRRSIRDALFQTRLKDFKKAEKRARIAIKKYHS